MELVLCLCILVLYLLYKWATATYDYFEKQGIAFRKPQPFIGTNGHLLTRNKSLIDVLDEWYYEFPNEKVSGLFEFRRPIVFVRDPKLLKHLAVKQFDHFPDHRTVITEDVDPMFGKALSSLTGQKWRDMRATLSPAFTGSKMRQMFSFVNDVGQQTASTLKMEILKSGQNALEFKSLSMKFTVDVIASCAFGIQVNSFKHPDNDFHRIAKKVTDFTSAKTALKFAGYLIAPKLMKMLDIHILDKECCDFFAEAICETMKEREQKGIIRHDMINLLLQARKFQLVGSNASEEKIVDGFATVEESLLGKLKVESVWDDEDLAAQCFIFFLAGFDTIATTMSFLAYELVCNPEVQRKLYEDIHKMNEELDGKRITYEQIQGMKYLDQVVSETLRKWPAATVTDRLCVKDYDLEFDNKTIHFEPNLNFFIPIWCFHRDPKYFPQPETFDPERFSDANRHKIDPDTYLPFGIGPRNCIGSRFALMELKTIFYFLLLNFSFEVTAKTQIPLQIAKTAIGGIKPEKRIWIALKPRD